MSVGGHLSVTGRQSQEFSFAQLPPCVSFWSLHPVWLVPLASAFAASKMDEVASGRLGSSWGRGVTLGSRCWSSMGALDGSPGSHFLAPRGCFLVRSRVCLYCCLLDCFRQLCAQGGRLRLQRMRGQRGRKPHHSLPSRP